MEKKDAIVRTPRPEVDPDVQLVRDCKRAFNGIFSALEKWIVAKKRLSKKDHS